MNILYLECASGISGDMTVAALLDLGADEGHLRGMLRSLGVSGYEVAISRVEKNGIGACDFDVRLEQEARGEGHAHSHSHDHEHEGHSHGHDSGHGHTHGEHSHSHGSDHSHPHGDHGHSHAHGEQGHHQHRSLPDIISIIENSALTARAKALAIKTFTIVAEAEAVVHQKPVAEVHFHEVGAIDSIVDIVAAAVCLDQLEIGRVVCTPLREGSGTIRCQHGVIPVPAPATVEIARANNVPLQVTRQDGELVTPTGAAIVAAITDSFQPPEHLRILKTGYGAGKREYPHTANLLRASLVEEVQPAQGDLVVKLECNLDDITGEELAYACERLLEGGALDVWCTPILMKKGRAAQMVSVLCALRQEEALTGLLFAHTPTLGVRTSRHSRHLMRRRISQVETSHGMVAIKEAGYGKICKIKVEYESAKQLAERDNVPINQIFRSAYHKLSE